MTNTATWSLQKDALRCLALLWATSVSAAVLPVGSGSYAEPLNPESYGCVVDNGNGLSVPAWSSPASRAATQRVTTTVSLPARL